MTVFLPTAPRASEILDRIARPYSYGSRKGGFRTVWAIKRQQPGANWNNKRRFPAEAVGAIAAGGSVVILSALFAASGIDLLSGSNVLLLSASAVVALVLGAAVWSLAPPATMVLRNRFDRRYRLLVDPGHAILTLSISRHPEVDGEGRVIIESKDFAVMRRGGGLGESLMDEVCADTKKDGVRMRGRAQNGVVAKHYVTRYRFEVETDLTTWFPPRTQIPRVDAQPRAAR